MRHDEANGDENNKNENYLALGLEGSAFKSLGGEDSKSRDVEKESSRSRGKDRESERSRREIGSETAIVEIAIVREMMMITEFEGGGLAIVRERRDTGDVHALDREVARVGLSIDHVPGQDHRPRARG